MRELLGLKESIKKFVGRNEAIVFPVLKFLLAFVALLQINSKLGYMAKLANFPIALIVALAASFLPINLTLIILALIITANVYALSMECALLVLAMFVILFLLYFRFASKDSVAAALTPMMSVIGIPHTIPVSMGLVGSLSSMVSVCCGTVIYYVLRFISDNAEAIMSREEDTAMSFKEVVSGIVGNRDMVVVAAAFAITVMVVYFIRRSSIDHSWLIAIFAGNITCFMTLLIGNVAAHAHVNMGLAFLGIIISIILNIILQFFCFDLNYNRTEKVQFEDDEYYYYVKAVPKNVLKEADNSGYDRVRRAPERRVERPVYEEESAAKTEVRRRAAEAARNTQRRGATKPADPSKGPFGLSGGRPAGEGRRNGQNN
ncbi:MAG: hypothetical protein J6U37_00580 [Lachnospiraceae bacterium]|nr:hypothetical protein [Lachnospiraceae bacterium]